MTLHDINNKYGDFVRELSIFLTSDIVMRNYRLLGQRFRPAKEVYTAAMEDLQETWNKIDQPVITDAISALKDHACWSEQRLFTFGELFDGRFEEIPGIVVKAVVEDDLVGLMYAAMTVQRESMEHRACLELKALRISWNPPPAPQM